MNTVPDMQVSKDLLRKEIGKVVYNTKHDIVGRIADIINDVKDKPNYVILSCDKLKGFGSKYFAIPFNRAFVKIIDDGEMILNIKKADLKKARRIDFDEGFFTNDKSLLKKIFQLINYHSSFRKRAGNKR